MARRLSLAFSTLAGLVMSAHVCGCTHTYGFCRVFEVVGFWAFEVGGSASQISVSMGCGCLHGGGGEGCSGSGINF